MGNPTWTTDGSLSTLPGRIQRQDEIDQGIEKWTLTLEKYELTQKCQAAGVRAIAVQSSQDRVEHDPQLRERGMYSELEHPMLGTWKFQNAPFKLSKSPAEVYRPPPMIGQHNKEIMEELLGISHQELQQDPEDGRGMRVTMTERGLSLHDRVFRAFATASTRLLVALSNRERAELDRALKQTLDAIEERSDDAMG